MCLYRPYNKVNGSWSQYITILGGKTVNGLTPLMKPLIYKHNILSSLETGGSVMQIEINADKSHRSFLH